MAGSRHQGNLRGTRNRPDPNGWQIVYTGFVLILLSFFIMLTSFASLQQSKITRFVHAFSTAVSVFKGGKNLEPGQTMIDGQAAIVDKEDKIARLFEKVRELSQANNLSQVGLRKTRSGVAMTLSEKLLFASGEARLNPQAFPLIHSVSRIIGQINVPVEIQGHTDSQPIQTAQFPSNWELSTARAVNVLRRMIDFEKVDSGRVSAVGFAEFQPLATNDSPDHMARNRRVEIVFKL
jgi:chemotaxis protein MotB